MTQFCHLLQADDDDVSLVDRRQDASPRRASTTQRLNKVLDELASTEQQYVKVELLFIRQTRKHMRVTLGRLLLSEYLFYIIVAFVDDKE